MTRADTNTPAIQMAARVSFHELENLTMFLLRCKTVFMLARQHLQPEHFSRDYEVGHQACWRSMLRLHNDYPDNLPTREMLEAAVHSDLEASHDPREMVEVKKDISGFFAWAYAPELASPPEAYGFDLLRRFLGERDVIDPLMEYMNEMGSLIPACLPDVVKNLSDRSSRLQAIGYDPVGNLIPKKGGGKIATPIRTGVDFFDISTDGGSAAGEVVLIAGATGAGKTTIAAQIAVSMAQTEMAQAITNSNYVPGHVYYLTYEQPQIQIQRKMISCAAQIPLGRVRIGDDVADWVETLSTIERPASLNSYENAIRYAGGKVVGERERYESLALPLDELLHVVDMSGPKESPKTGTGGVSEICAVLENKIRGGHKRASLVIIDYALIAARRYIESRGWDVTQRLRHVLSTFGDETRRLVAEQFQCPVLMLTQLSGQANEKSPTADYSHADAAECRTMADNAVHAFIIGNQDKATSCFRWHQSKARFSKVLAEPYILRFTDMSTVERADSAFVVDHSARKIMPRDIAFRLHGATPEEAAAAESRMPGRTRPSVRRTSPSSAMGLA